MPDTFLWLPIGKRALHYLETYLNDVRPLLVLTIQDTTLFLTDYGEAYTGSMLGRMVKKLMQQADINVTGSCHLFRHAMATHMLENGADIRFIQAMLGHRDLNTTEIYTQVSFEKLKEIHQAAHTATQNKTRQAVNNIDNKATLETLLNHDTEDETDTVH